MGKKCRAFTLHVYFPPLPDALSSQMMVNLTIIQRRPDRTLLDFQTAITRVAV